MSKGAIGLLRSAMAGIVVIVGGGILVEAFLFPIDTNSYIAGAIIGTIAYGVERLVE